MSARGGFGFPNLTDDEWQWGGDFDTIKSTIHGGRMAAMPAWGPALGDSGVADMAQYVLILSGAPHDQTAAAARAAPQFQMLCVACHGAEGQWQSAVRRAGSHERRLALRRRRGHDRIHAAQRSQRPDAEFRTTCSVTIASPSSPLTSPACDQNEPRQRADHRNRCGPTRRDTAGFTPVDLYQRREKIFTRAIEGRFQRIRLVSGLAAAARLSAVCRGSSGALARRCCSICRRGTSTFSA